MGDRGLAPVVDLGQRRRRGSQIGVGQAHRVNPAARPPVRESVVDWEAVRRLSRAEQAAVAKGRRRAPTKAGKFRRYDDPVPAGRPPMPRQARRLAWKMERRLAKVAWADSQAKTGVLAAVIPIGSRATQRRYRGAA